MSETELDRLKRLNDNSIHGYDAVDELISAFRALSADRAELRAAADMLAEARTTCDRAERQKLLEMAEARARDATKDDTTEAPRP